MKMEGEHRVSEDKLEKRTRVVRSVEDPTSQDGYMEGADEEEQPPLGEMTENCPDDVEEGTDYQNDPYPSEDQSMGQDTESSSDRDERASVEVVNEAEESVTFSVRGDDFEDLSVILYSLAAYGIKDVRRESDGVNFVVSIPRDTTDRTRRELVVEIRTALEEACCVDARRRDLHESAQTTSRGYAGQRNDDLSKLEEGLPGTTRPYSLRESRGRPREEDEASQAERKRVSVARKPSIGLNGYDGQASQHFGEETPGASLNDDVKAAVSALEERTSDPEKGVYTPVQSQRPRRPRRGDTTPGAFYSPGQAEGAPPEWSERNAEREREGPSPVVDSVILGSEGVGSEVVGSAVTAFRVDETATEENVRQRILEEAVEADVIDQKKVTKTRRYRILIFICVVIVLVGIAIGLGVALSRKENTVVLVTEAPTRAPTMSPTEAPRPTLEKVRSRGAVRCGTFADLPGLYSMSDETKQYEGFNVDLCRAIAAAALGDSNSIEIIPVGDDSRFEALQTGSIDVLARATTHTMSREVVETSTGAGFSFSVPFLYSGLVFAGKEAFVKCAESLDTFFGICKQLKICVNKDKSLEDVVDTLFPSAYIHRTMDEIEEYVNGTCNVVATEPVYSHQAVFEAAGYSGQLTSGSIPFSREPLALVTRKDDPDWSDLVNAVLQALMVAEVQNVTQLTASSFRSTPELGSFKEDVFTDVIAAVGNYGEIFSRHLTGVIARTGLNSLNLNGSTGLLYSFPFGTPEDLGPEPVEGGTLQAIRDRGYLRCGLSSYFTGFAEFDANRQEWTGLDVSFCRVVFSAVFGDEIDATIEFVSLSNLDQYVALASGDVDVLAGGMASLVNEVLEPTSSKAFSFSSPYFYGSPDGYLSNESTRSLVTRQDDTQWSTFVYWTLMSTIFAEERHIGRNNTHLMPVVNLFGEGFADMFRDVVASNGNYGDIYGDTLEEHIPRAGRNQLNNPNNHGPQQYPYEFP